MPKVGATTWLIYLEIELLVSVDVGEFGFDLWIRVLGLDFQDFLFF